MIYKRRRFPPPRPKGFYLDYLLRLIEENRRKGTPAPDIYDERLRNDALKDQSLDKKAA
jgi:hypothetical protein